MGARCSKLSLCFWPSNIKSNLNDSSDKGQVYHHHHFWVNFTSFWVNFSSFLLKLESLYCREWEQKRKRLASWVRRVQLGPTESCHVRVLVGERGLRARRESSQCGLQRDSRRRTLDRRQAVQPIGLARFAPISCKFG